MTTAHVTVVIVNFNGAEVLPGCLAGVLAQDYPAFDVLVVDNASSDRSADRAEREFPGIRVVRSPRNLGFAGGGNLGFRESRGDYVALLNTDAVPETGWLTALVRGLEERGLALASSLVVTDGVPAAEYEMNGTVNYLGYNLPREFADLTTVFYCSGAALLIRRGELDRLFPEPYFLYQEDVYLSWRLRLRGRPLGMVPASRVSHRGSHSTDRLARPEVAYYQERNRLLNCLVFYRPWTLVRIVPYVVVDALVKLVAGLSGRAKSPAAVLRAYGGVVALAGWILRERRLIQRERSVPDRAVLSMMTCRVVRGSPQKLPNRLSRIYARLAGLAFHG